MPPPKGGEASTRKGGEGAPASGVEAPKKGLKRKGVCPTPGVDADRARGDSRGGCVELREGQVQRRAVSAEWAALSLWVGLGTPTLSPQIYPLGGDGVK